MCLPVMLTSQESLSPDISGAVYSKTTLSLFMYLSVMLKSKESSPWYFRGGIFKRNRAVYVCTSDAYTPKIKSSPDISGAACFDKKKSCFDQKKTIKTCSCVSTYWWCLHPKNPSPDISGAVFENQINSCAWIYQWCLHPKDPPSDISGAVCLKGKKR